MMDRGHVQNSLIQLLRDNNFSADATHQGKYRSIPFYNEKRISGELKVFAENYIVIRWNGSCSKLPFQGSEKFASLVAAKDFLTNYITKDKEEDYIGQAVHS